MVSLSLAWLNYLFPLRINISFSPVITAADGSVINAFLSQDDKWRMKLEADEINPVLEKAILLKEDKYFYYHPGVNPVAWYHPLPVVFFGYINLTSTSLSFNIGRLPLPR